MNMKDQRLTKIIDIPPKEFRTKFLSDNQDNHFILFDDWQLGSSHQDWLIAWGEKDKFVISQKDSTTLQDFDRWLKSSGDWKVGYINYDLKNNLNSQLQVREKATLTADLLYFFIPEIIFRPKGGQVEALYHSGAKFPILSNDIKSAQSVLHFKLQTTQKQYLQNIKLIQEKIAQNELQEINYCIEWQSDDILINPAHSYLHLQQEMCAPFSCYFKINDTHLICNSPERYLKKSADKLISQPIKGTSKRYRDKKKDEESRNLLLTHKEQNENILAAQLVQQDFKTIAVKDSIETTELAQIYSYETVHQLVSTITCLLKKDIQFSDILQATFPMGSMTGLPRENAIQTAEDIEMMHRDIYSGTVGYITPDDDFDFNVVIRSLIYFQQEHKTYLRTGGGITQSSIPESEWKECHLKADKILKFFTKKSD
ncbi:MAG: chorismate-binding protein [Chitinophagales bacterium]|nr:chorismate-binding protein [Chitinophagales bacterium]